MSLLQLNILLLLDFQPGNGSFTMGVLFLFTRSTLEKDVIIIVLAVNL